MLAACAASAGTVFRRLHIHTPHTSRHTVRTPHRMGQTQRYFDAGAGVSGAGDTASAGASRPHRASRDSLRASARASSLGRSGRASPVSHLLTACRDTCTRAASSSWLQPRFFRSWTRMSFSSMTPLLSVRIIPDGGADRNQPGLAGPQPGVAGGRAAVAGWGKRVFFVELQS